MMIRKIKQTVWHNSHAHHDSRRENLYPPFWRRGDKADDTGHDEQPANDGTPALYPAAVLKSFEDAIKRCPSISIDADIMEGQPCIAGTRIPVRAVLRVIEQYGAVEDVKVCYPQLTIGQVEDALYFSQVILELSSGVNETAVVT
jgi:uncharacterized protein (DUF433 family)